MEMSETKENIITHAMRSGLVLGGSMIIFNIISLLMPPQTGILLSFILNIASLAISIYCIFHFTQKFNVNVLNGEITYMKAVSYSIYMFFFASMLLAVFSYIYYQFISPESLTEQIDLFTISSKKEGLIKDENTAKMLDEIKQITAKDVALLGLWMYTFLGFILSLFTSIAFRKKINYK